MELLNYILVERSNKNEKRNTSTRNVNQSNTAKTEKSIWNRMQSEQELTNPAKKNNKKYVIETEVDYYYEHFIK